MAKQIINNRKSMKIVVLTGGFEPERHAAFLAGKNVKKGLLDAGYKNVNLINVNTNIIRNLQKIKPDFAFVAMLCKWGEDGIIQSLLEIMGIPYSGNDVEASAICNNKYFFTQFVKACGFKAPDSLIVSDLEELNEIAGKIKYPCIIKPAYQGYSIGVFLIKNKKDLLKKGRESFQFSSKIVAQEYIKGREFTLGLIEVPNKGVFVLPAIELKVHGSEIQDLKSKDKSHEFIEKTIPAHLTKHQQTKLESISVNIFKLLGATGVSRFDIRLNKKGEFYFLENNSFPGIPNINTSYITTELKAAGISFEDFLDFMVISGLRRKQNKLDYKYE